MTERPVEQAVNLIRVEIERMLQSKCAGNVTFAVNFSGTGISTVNVEKKECHRLDGKTCK